MNTTHNYYIRYEKGAVPMTDHLKKRFESGDLTSKDKKYLWNLERYVKRGMKSFHRPTSIVIQGWSIEATKKNYFNDYLEIVTELNGNKARLEVIEKKLI